MPEFSAIDGSFVPVPHPAVATAALEGDGVLFDERSNAVHVLNATALAVWETLDGHATVDRVVDTLAAAFGLESDQIRKDVVETVRDFAGRSLLADDDGRGYGSAASLPSSPFELAPPDG